MKLTLNMKVTTCDNNKCTVDGNDFNTHEYFSHVLQVDSFTDLTACKSKVDDDAKPSLLNTI